MQHMGAFGLVHEIFQGLVRLVDWRGWQNEVQFDLFDSFGVEWQVNLVNGLSTAVHKDFKAFIEESRANNSSFLEVGSEWGQPNLFGK